MKKLIQRAQSKVCFAVCKNFGQNGLRCELRPNGKKMQWMVIAAIFSFCGCLTAAAQETEQFSIATLNVDGLPQKLLVWNLNAEGPGSAGSARIGKYLVRKGYDLVMMQEDFNYHDVLTVMLEDAYRMDEWSGDIGVEDRNIDFLHLQNHRFACDGLMACWKNDLMVTSVGRTPWLQNFGKFSHANDEMVTKGFRRYDVTLRSGARIVVYNMHMDATLDEDETEMNGEKDREARVAQWMQLKDEVLRNLDERPVVITGDMNSFYGRDDVKRIFIDAINESGRGTAADVWVELQQRGVYPEFRVDNTDLSNIRNGESLDKIIYINPVSGMTIQPVSFSIDIDGYRYDDRPLGDHYPVAATFQVESSDNKVTGIEDKSLQDSEKSIYDLNGVRVSQPRNGVFIQNGNKTYVK